MACKQTSSWRVGPNLCLSHKTYSFFPHSMCKDLHACVQLWTPSTMLQSILRDLKLRIVVASWLNALLELESSILSLKASHPALSCILSVGLTAFFNVSHLYKFHQRLHFHAHTLVWMCWRILAVDCVLELSFSRLDFCILQDLGTVLLQSAQCCYLT